MVYKLLYNRQLVAILPFMLSPITVVILIIQSNLFHEIDKCHRRGEERENNAPKKEYDICLSCSTQVSLIFILLCGESTKLLVGSLE